MHTPRIAPLSEHDPSYQELLGATLLVDGQALNAASTMARNPRLLKRFTVLAGYFLSHSTLPERDRELITLRCAYRLGGEYYFGHHVLLASDVLSPSEIAASTGDVAVWSAPDDLLLSAVDELIADANLSDEAWGTLARRYEESQLLDFVMLVGFYRMTCQYVNTVGIGREPGVPGWPS